MITQMLNCGHCGMIMACVEVFGQKEAYFVLQISMSCQQCGHFHGEKQRNE